MVHALGAQPPKGAAGGAPDGGGDPKQVGQMLEQIGKALQGKGEEGKKGGGGCPNCKGGGGQEQLGPPGGLGGGPEG